MNKIFKDLVREKIKAEFLSTCKPLYEYVETSVSSQNQQFQLDDEQQQYTEEVVFGIICGLKKIGAIIQIGAAVASIKYASFERETLCLSVIGRITEPTVKQLK